MSALSLQTLHLFNRLCFGGRLKDLDNPEAAIWKEPTAASKQLFGSMPSYKPLKSYSEEFMVDKSEFARVEENRKVYPNSFDEITHNWLRHTADSNNPIREKAALFWMHFIPVIGEGEARVKPLLEIYRKHALGKLEDLFFDLFLNPNFMSFLTAVNSSKDSPNQNLAREFMELFTLGVNHYTENDVRELARCFAGFVQPNEKIQTLSLKAENQDFGEKTLMGQRKAYDYKEAIRWIIAQPQTSQFIAKRVLQFYVTTGPSAEMVEACAEVYHASGHQFQSLLEFMVGQPWFYDAQYMGNKVKTPIELLLQFQHQTGLRTYGLMCHWHMQRWLGQQLFNPPSVGGWPDGNQWLNGSVLVSRLSLLQNLLIIANRTHPKNGFAYKLHSWLSHYSLRLFRWNMDAKFDEDAYLAALEKHKISESHWLLGSGASKLSAKEQTSLGLSELLQHPYYQYC
jgi:uncharacterized protein (DUF1800 family)